ncbi:MAG: hypothetical protein PHU46_08340 [Rhodocyclaceae bacterium]|nr:hypothetical protein [Rhodocyclaceae bacterium]
MGAITFDTLKFSDTLKASGVPPMQAEAEARALAAAISEVDVASKRDVAESTSSIRGELEVMRRDMQAMELRLTVKLGAVIVATAGIVVGLLRLPH